jgi:hypothetical protein
MNVSGVGMRFAIVLLSAGVHAAKLVKRPQMHFILRP